MKTLNKKTFYLIVSPAALVVVFALLYFRAERSNREADPVRPGKSGADCTLTVCSEIKEGRPAGRRKKFGFSEKIYAFADIRDVPPGRHRLTFHWINPRRKVQETFRKEFSAVGGGYRSWAWLELEGEFFPISLGPIGSGKFFGKWTVKTFLDGFFLAEADFEVR